MKYAHEAKLPVNKVHQKWMLDRYEDLYRDSNNEFNTKLQKEEYESVGHILLESGLINTMTSYDEFYQPIIDK
jgi:NitT/TauT family transport system substrate-binding protein